MAIAPCKPFKRLVGDPARLSIVGSNDSPIAALTQPAPDSSCAPYYELAREAAQALIAQWAVSLSSR